MNTKKNLALIRASLSRTTSTNPNQQQPDHHRTTNQSTNQQPEKLNVYKNDTDSSWDYTLGKDLRFFLS